jgi:hypothetical protein
MPNPDLVGVPAAGGEVKFGYVFRDGIIQGDAALVHEAQNRGGREHLADRAVAEQRVLVDGATLVAMFDAVAPFIGDLAVRDHRNSQAGNVVGRHRGLDTGVNHRRELDFDLGIRYTDARLRSTVKGAQQNPNRGCDRDGEALICACEID